jgi:hypothetical protein
MPRSRSTRHPIRAHPPPRALTSPASWDRPARHSNSSVKVFLPASGCEMIAKVRRRKISSVRVLIHRLELLLGQWPLLASDLTAAALEMDMMSARRFANGYRTPCAWAKQTTAPAARPASNCTPRSLDDCGPQSLLGEANSAQTHVQRILAERPMLRICNPRGIGTVSRKRIDLGSDSDRLCQSRLRLVEIAP